MDGCYTWGVSIHGRAKREAFTGEGPYRLFRKDQNDWFSLGVQHRGIGRDFDFGNTPRNCLPVERTKPLKFLLNHFFVVSVVVSP
jgi:hypothetical protein